MFKIEAKLLPYKKKLYIFFNQSVLTVEINISKFRRASIAASFSSRQQELVLLQGLSNPTSKPCLFKCLVQHSLCMLVVASKSLRLRVGRLDVECKSCRKRSRQLAELLEHLLL